MASAIETARKATETARAVATVKRTLTNDGAAIEYRERAEHYKRIGKRPY